MLHTHAGGSAFTSLVPLLLPQLSNISMTIALGRPDVPFQLLGSDGGSIAQGAVCGSLSCLKGQSRCDFHLLWMKRAMWSHSGEEPGACSIEGLHPFAVSLSFLSSVFLPSSPNFILSSSAISTADRHNVQHETRLPFLQGWLARE